MIIIKIIILYVIQIRHTHCHWVQAKIIGIDGGYNSDPEYIPPPPSL